MSTFFLSEFTSADHTLSVEPAGVFSGGERWRFHLWCGDALIFTEREFCTPAGWCEDKVAAHALFWATLDPDECESAREPLTGQQRAWLDSCAEYLSLALLESDGSDVDTLTRYRADA
ncbi:hypothetical protein GCM10023224_15750 [Streptomonospora halophila]|uniref:Immunity protein 53 n=1 Tax=Streptomonospora halophila TaxID=427369 RepID=A0ABP9GAU2_9ACTN